MIEIMVVVSLIGILAPFNHAGTVFGTLGFRPEGQVYFSYGVGVSADGIGFTADAGADVDGVVQFWGFAKPDGSNAKVSGQVGCNVSAIGVMELRACGAGYGQSIF